jgi:U2 small nuclear ribonucleoprotein A'
MRLTPDAIRRAVPYTNPLGQRELGFRNSSISILENLGILEDIYECLDFTNNKLMALDNIPQLTKLEILLLSHNSISKISPTLGKSLPNLTAINLSHNNISSFNELIPLREFPSLTTLILNDNPIVSKYTNFKTAILVLLPNLLYLNHESIQDELREEAKKMKKALKKGATLESLLLISSQYQLTQNTTILSTKPAPSSMNDQ